MDIFIFYEGCLNLLSRFIYFSKVVSVFFTKNQGRDRDGRKKGFSFGKNGIHENTL